MSFNNILKSISLFAVVALVGCSHPAKMEEMVVYPTDIKECQPPAGFLKNITLETVTGGKETNPLWLSNVASEDFEKALEKSLEILGVFTSDNGRYSLNAKLLSVSKPFMSLNMTVYSSVHYTLTDLKTKAVLFDEDIGASYTTTVGEAFAWRTRLRLAVEGSIYENIRQLLKEICRTKPT